jgi:AcrR family transcriptional regulator
VSCFVIGYSLGSEPGQQSKGAELFTIEQNRKIVQKRGKDMPGNDLDRRIQKTRHLLQNALAELVEEKEYNDITIQEILDRANVGRSTFYTHFEHKDQLLRSLLTGLKEMFEEGGKQSAAGDKSLADNGALLPLRALQFVEQNHRLFKALLGQHGHGPRNNPFYDYLFGATREHFRLMIGREKSDTRGIEVATHYYTSAAMGVLEWWVDSDMVCSAEEAFQTLNQLTLHGLKEVFGV